MHLLYTCEPLTLRLFLEGRPGGVKVPLRGNYVIGCVSSLIIGPRGLVYKTCPANFLMWSNLTFDPSKVKLGSSIFKGSITCVILVLDVSNVMATCRKSCPVNLLMRSNLTFDPSIKVKLGSTIFKRPKNHLLLALLLVEVWDIDPL